MNNKIFKSTIEHLLSGKIIDEYKYQDNFIFLRNQDTLNEVNQYLDRVNRRCVTTRDGKGYVLTFTEEDDKAAKASAREMIREYITTLKPFIEWLKWTSIISEDETVLSTGVEIRFEEIHKHLDGNKAMQQTLHQLKDHLSSSQSQNANDHLKTVLNWFEKNDYLVKNDLNGLSYTATAKWSVYEDCLEFIATAINLNRNLKDYPEQGSLFDA